MNEKMKRRAIIATLASSPIWAKPVIRQVTLPAHANTTDDTGSSGPGATTTSAPALTNTSFFNSPPTITQNTIKPDNESGNALLDAFISPVIASQVGPGADLGMLITLSEVNGKVVANSRHMNLRRTNIYTASGIPTDSSAASTPLTNSDFCYSPNNSHTHIKIVGYSFNDSSIDVEITTTGSTPTRTQTISVGSGAVELLCNDM